jgi:hypothetical protein
MARGVGIAATAACALIGAGPAAAATQRYADPSGSGSACTEVAPCKYEVAVNGAATGDEVIVRPGSHGTPGSPITTNVVSTVDINVHGVEGQPRPTIYAQNTFPLSLTGTGSTARHLEIHQLNTGVESTFRFKGIVAEDLIVQTAANNGCELLGTALLRNSVCVTTRAPGRALIASGSLQAGIDATVRNVTAYAPGAGAHAIRVSSAMNRPTKLTAVNTIAIGGGLDLSVISASDANATLVVRHDNFRTKEATVSSGTGTSAIDDDGSSKSAQPLLVDPPGGDFHQVASSPTIDAGVADAANGSLDFEGDPRTLGPQPDVGADEHPAAMVPALDVIAPLLDRVTATKVFAPVAVRRSTTARRKRLARGARFRYRLSEAASVRVRIERRLAGRRVGKRCLAPRKRLRKRRRCTRHRLAGTVRFTGKPGRNSSFFSGRIGKRALRRGRYRALLVATDPAGNRSRTRTVRFRVVRAPKRKKG